MASFKIIQNETPYITLDVIFGDNIFRQTIITNKTWTELTEFIQDYVNQYEYDYNNED